MSSAERSDSSSADLLSGVHPQLLQDQLADYSRTQQTALKRSLARVLLKQSPQGKQKPLTADFVACIFFLTLRSKKYAHEQASADLEADARKRLGTNKAFQPKNVPHSIWAIEKYGRLERTLDKRACYKFGAEKLFDKLQDMLQHEGCNIASFRGGDSNPFAGSGSVLHWDAPNCGDPRQPDSFCSICNIAYTIGDCQCALPHVAALMRIPCVQSLKCVWIRSGTLWRSTCMALICKFEQSRPHIAI